MRKRKVITITSLAIIATLLLITWFCNKAITDAAKNKLYTDLQNIPYNRVGLLLGTSKSGRFGHDNLYYNYRIEAAANLVKNKKIKYLIISGDNSTKNYNEPETMRSDLIHAGIDSSIIYLDYAGFRTFDSIKRLKEIFGQGSVTVISQKFHNERAIYLASREGITAIGYNAKDVTTAHGFKTQRREKMARVKVFIDYLFGTKPKFLGDKINIPS